MDESLDPALRSWVESANASGADFPIQNLPYCVFLPRGAAEGDWRIGVGIGERILDLRAVVGAGALSPLVDAQVCATLCAGQLNAYMARGPEAWGAVRRGLSRLLATGAPQRAAVEPCLHAQADARFRVPARIGDYTDFFTSIHHATRVGQLLRPDQPLLPNYKWVPIAYHGRSSSIQVSGEPVVRPHGQIAPRGATQPQFGASGRLDYELELAAYVGAGNALGTSVPMAAAEQQVFGLCLLNDWSARDIQAWEYQPLGPFLAKSFATTVSPWIVPLAALEPFRLPWSRPAQDPQPLAYLDSADLRQRGAIDIRLRVQLRSARMRASGLPALTLSESHYRDAYWSLAQMVAHHTIAGCNLCPGDLLATGTQSGAAPEQGGCLLELTQGGKQAIALPGGEERRFLEDGDEVSLLAWCERPGAVRIGFGLCTGTVVPAGARLC